MTHAITLNVTGGPATSDASRDRWEMAALAVTDQVENLLAVLGLEGDFTLEAIASAKGSDETQGLHPHRYISDLKEPALLLLAQPFEAETCWLWRLVLPKESDALLRFGQISRAIEEGHHLVDKWRNGASAQLPLIVKEVEPSETHENASQEPESVPGSNSDFDIGRALSDNKLMHSLLSAVFSRAATMGLGRTTAYESALDEVRKVTRCSPRSAGAIISAFRSRGWVSRDKKDRTVTVQAKGLAILEKDMSSAARSPAEVQSLPVKDQQVLPRKTSLAEQIRELQKKAVRYQEGARVVTEREEELLSLERELKSLEERKVVLTGLIEQVKAALAAARTHQTDATLSAANAELESIRQLLKPQKDE